MNLYNSPLETPFVLCLDLFSLASIITTLRQLLSGDSQALIEGLHFQYERSSVLAIFISPALRNFLSIRCRKLSYFMCCAQCNLRLGPLYLLLLYLLKPRTLQIFKCSQSTTRKPDVPFCKKCLPNPSHDVLHVCYLSWKIS